MSQTPVFVVCCCSVVVASLFYFTCPFYSTKNGKEKEARSRLMALAFFWLGIRKPVLAGSPNDSRGNLVSFFIANSRLSFRVFRLKILKMLGRPSGPDHRGHPLKSLTSQMQVRGIFSFTLCPYTTGIWLPGDHKRS